MDSESKFRKPTGWWLEFGAVVNADGSVETGIVRVRHDANSPQGEIRELASREFLESGQAQFGAPHAKPQKIEENSELKLNGGSKAKVLRLLASAMFGASRIFGRLGQRFLAMSAPARSFSSLQLAALDGPGYSLEEILASLGCEAKSTPPPKSSLPTAKSCPIVASPDIVPQAHY